MRTYGHEVESLFQYILPNLSGFFLFKGIFGCGDLSKISDGGMNRL